LCLLDYESGNPASLFAFAGKTALSRGSAVLLSTGIVGEMWFASPFEPMSLVAGKRCSPVVLVIAAVILVLSLVFAAVRREHSTPIEQTPLHQAK
jgi:hypothetical protein